MTKPMPYSGTGIGDRRFTFWCSEVNDLTVLFEHIDLLNCLNGLHIQLLQGALQLLVICAGTLVRLLDLATRRPFSSDSDSGSLSLEPGELGLIHDFPELDPVSTLQQQRQIPRAKGELERGWTERCWIAAGEMETGAVCWTLMIDAGRCPLA